MTGVRRGAPRSVASSNPGVRCAWPWSLASFLSCEAKQERVDPSIDGREVPLKNRKTAEKYRLDGLSGIKPVQMAQLDDWVGTFRAKLADPSDVDDERWTA